MRTPGDYPTPKFSDPNDERFVKLVRRGNVPARNSVNIVGIPFDGAVLGRKGASEGPGAIRQATASFSNYDAQSDVSLNEGRIVDLGDVTGLSDDVLKSHNTIEEELAEAYVDGSLLVALGGDNSVSLPCLKAFAGKFRRIGLIVIDSHLDLRGEIGGKPTSGSSYGLAVRSIRGLPPTRVVEVGHHGFLNSKSYIQTARKMGIELVGADEVAARGAKAVAEEAYRKASRGAEAVYLSIDLDAVDLASVSGVSAPSSGGISSRELFEMAFEIARRDKVKGADIVELAPSLDPTGRSQLVAATVLVHLVGGFVSRSA
ncbi:MAG TPA: agmatinase family protein [Nitrososphaerales archaeon]|nr:agmatinase family protein [Nitrososphaerales archaeon]